MAEPLTLAHANGNPLPAPRHGQSPRPYHRGHRHRQERSPCRCWRRVFPPRRAGLSGRREGDLSGLSAAGTPSAKLDARLAQLGLPGT